MRFEYCPPVLVQKFFSNFFWSTSNNKILLTFDDGPTETATLKILNTLGRNNLKAIFFCVGSNIKKHPALVEKILENGHMVANHTMNHKLITKMTREESVREINSFNEIIKEKFRISIKFFRPPHGKFNLGTNGLMKELNLKCVMWNLLTYDYENNIDKVKYAIDNYLKGNSIIVFHDSIKSNSIIEKALDYTVEKATKNGYIFGEPEDCLK